MTAGTFVCNCGTRLRIFTEGKDTTIVPCPNPSCQARHIVSGEVCDVQVDRSGQWVSYDWKVKQDIL